MADEPNPYKAYNEQIKTFETLAKREAELVQKLSQADAEKDLAAKITWAEELSAVLQATQKLQLARIALLKSL